ncbi:MAG: hypothetical protein HWD86_04580 [Kangiellaceae bacterium]|nr:hypothetical protein [Kangiellaceae bacterium]
MAGTAAVFIHSEQNKASPVERDGLIWNEQELKFDHSILQSTNSKEAMANAIALEGLEDYDPPQNGDKRYVESLDAEFIYIQESKSWVQI